MSGQTKPVAIVGGGLAGLTAANELKQRGIPFTLFEAGPRIAGLASSFKDDEGFSYDFGAHFITNRLADAIGIGSECLTVRRYGERVWLAGKSYSYPFGLIRIPRMVIGGLKAKLSPNGTPAVSAADWFRKSYGSALADEVALPLIEAWSGENSSILSSAVGDSLPGSIAKTLYLKMAGKVTRRAVACGYSRELPETPSVYHVYPKNGVAALCHKLAEGIEDKIRLNAPVDEIRVESERVVTVGANGETHEVAAAISTAPANILAKLVTGTDALDGLAGFRFRSMVFVNLKFKGRGLLPDTVLWLPEDRFPFFRLTEAALSMPWLAPEGKTMITADLGCEKGDATWQTDDHDLTELCLNAMTDLIPDVHGRYLGCNVLRTAISYPVFLNDYEDARRRFQNGTGIDNLLSIGRNGEFAHIFMEDVYMRTRAKVANLADRLCAGELSESFVDRSLFSRSPASSQTYEPRFQ